VLTSEASADENVEQPVLDWLRDTGHDVVSVAELLAAATDEEVLGLADGERRILLTNDKDFGALAYRQGRAAAGVILLRFRTQDGREKALHLARCMPRLAARVDGHFAAVNENRLRLRPLRR